jgi:hypothetical protein
MAASEAQNAGLGDDIAKHYNNLEEKGKDQRKDSR